MMWFFHTEKNECARFWYGGCGGNSNRFETQEECENLCLTKSRMLSETAPESVKKSCIRFPEAEGGRGQLRRANR
ncbi:unnamed protein product [Tetraodon nigroviridis]|uniref:(spotted green pufferfish) hypothetical protein n=1 Tax=Tetraodon nigroviridis TaxID=99883 RepID=Q4TBB8_TETNG|nr:unnamed protein product [Tetraodon nigroviridis]